MKSVPAVKIGKLIVTFHLDGWLEIQLDGCHDCVIATPKEVKELYEWMKKELDKRS